MPITSTLKQVQNEYIEESFCQYVVYFEDSNMRVQALKNTSTHPMLESLQNSHHAGLVLFFQVEALENQKR